MKIKNSTRDLEVVQSIWKMKPDIKSQETFSEPPTLAMVHYTVACILENKPDDVLSSGSLATSRVSKCFAPKERRIDLNYEN